MFVIENGMFSTQGTMLLIFSLVLGGLLGEVINIESKMDALGEKIKKAVKAEKDKYLIKSRELNDFIKENKSKLKIDI